VSVAEDPVTRLLVIDDSVRVRRAVTRALQREPSIEVVAAMRNGRAAVMRSERLSPDVVLLDTEVAVDDDCPTLAELRRLEPKVRIVLREAWEQMDEEQVRRWVLSALRGRRENIAAPAPEPRAPDPRAPDPRAAGRSAARRAPAARPAPRRHGPVRAVALAASTGGPDALESVLGRLPAGLPAPVFVVQHMPADFTRMLAERLDRRTPLTVQEAVAGTIARDGCVYIAPVGQHLALEHAPGGARIVTHHGPRENSCRPAADVLFRSAAALYGAGLLAVVLTGMGQDGLAGAAAVRRAGGRVMAQSEGTAVIASMPGAVARRGLADVVADLSDVGPRIAALACSEVAR
jgi:two-component system, chemotaxis family, protein-glutamate methylesterase/glutaminase